MSIKSAPIAKQYTSGSDVADHVDIVLEALIEDLEESVPKYPGDDNKEIRHILYKSIGTLKYLQKEML